MVRKNNYFENKIVALACIVLIKKKAHWMDHGVLVLPDTGPIPTFSQLSIASTEKSNKTYA